MDPRLLNPLLGALPTLLGATTTGGLYDATRHKTHQLPWSAHAPFFFFYKQNPPAGKLSNRYAENREISPSTGNPLLGSELPTDIQSRSGGAQLVELALFHVSKSWLFNTERYHRLFSCYTTATSRAPVFQWWRLNSWTLDFWTHCLARY